MTQQQQIIAQILAAEPWKRADILEAIEREYGRGFRKTVQEIVQPRATRNGIRPLDRARSP